MPIILRKIFLKTLIPLGLFILAFIVPIYEVSFDISTLVTSASLLFAILLGFFIATATTNYMNFQTLLAEEGSGLIMLFNLGVLVQPSAREKIAEVIDSYAIATLDFSLTDYIYNTRKEFSEIIEVVDSLEPPDEQKRRIAALSYMHETKSNVLKARESITFTAPQVTSGNHWFIIIAITIVLTVLLFTLRDGNLLASVIVGLLTATLYLILLLLYEVDANTFLEEQLAYSDVQKIFWSIGRLPYYPAYAIKNGAVKEPKGEYRVGVYDNYPTSTKKTIKRVNRKS